jgi:hypothetical protein
MTVYIVCGNRYDEINDGFVIENIAVYANEQQAQTLAKEAQAFDENEGYLSNFYWVETWEVK